MTWVAVAELDRLEPDRGACAKVGEVQVALFRLSGTGEVFALDNHDPFSGANVLARGIVGDRDGEPKVASPMYKQSFSLRTGQCLDDPAVRVVTYPVRLSGDFVEVWYEVAAQRLAG
jgi:nitrite reductase (NADH) small subunit